MNLNEGYMKNLAGRAAGSNGWFKTWFDSSFYHRLYAHRSEQEAADFIDTLIGLLDPAEGSRMLDLGCGAGRHAKHLASKGFNVTGLDLAASSIRVARQSEHERLQFYQHDMRNPFGRQYFHYVFNFFTSFGYFDTDEEHNAVIRNIANTLKPGGLAMMDYLNVAYSERHIVPREEKEIDGIAYHITRYSNDKHFFKKIVVEDVQPSGPLEYTEKVAKLYLKEFTHLFNTNGLELQQVFGDYGLNTYDEKSSPRLIMLATKK